MPLPVPLLTIDLLDDFPDDGTRYELLEGMLLVTPAPSNAHQVVATRLVHLLVTGLEPNALAQVVAVGAIQRGKHTQVQPDILVYPSAFSPTATGGWRSRCSAHRHGSTIARSSAAPISRWASRSTGLWIPAIAL